MTSVPKERDENVVVVVLVECLQLREVRLQRFRVFLHVNLVVD